jgi:histidyl-tRNA synthetase
MGYYTGQVFEISHPSSPSSLAGGGRYDKLIGKVLGRDVPACGFSLGFERITEIVVDATREPSLALLFDDGTPLTDVMSAARSLRRGGKSVSVVPRRGALGKQLATLESEGFSSYVIYYGRDTDLSERPLRQSSVSATEAEHESMR